MYLGVLFCWWIVVFRGIVCFDFLLVALRASYVQGDYFDCKNGNIPAWSECYNPEEKKITCDELMHIFKHGFKKTSLCFVCCVKDAEF